MEIVKTILLGALQGATEFLPVSSSGHLVAAQAVLGVHSTGVLLEVALHFGTLLAILVVFWRDLLRLATDGLTGAWLYLSGRGNQVGVSAPLFPAALAVVVGSVPVAIAGVFCEDALTRAFDSPAAAGAFLCVTGIALLLSRFAPAARTDAVKPVHGLLIGLAQAAALLPGISRSGSTIVAGYFVGLERPLAARFSFLLAVPALVGATGWESKHLLDGLPDSSPSPCAVLLGTLTAAAVGWVCLRLLLRVVQRGRLHWFGAYCLPVGAVILAAGLLT